MERKTKQARGSTLVGCLSKLLILLMVAMATFVTMRLTLQSTKISGDSMEPSLHDGQYLLVSKLAYRFRPPARGDIVLLRSPQEARKVLVKRIVGLPGEEITLKSGQVFINGHPLEEPYLLDPGRDSYGPLQLKEGHYFILGDNRLLSSDSRLWGPLSEEGIVGKAWLSLWPFRYGGRLPGVSYGDED